MSSGMGDVRDSVSGEEGGTPTVAAKHITEPPMSQRTATITSLPMAFEIVKAMQADGLDWGEGYRPLGRPASLAGDHRGADGRRGRPPSRWAQGR